MDEIDEPLGFAAVIDTDEYEHGLEKMIKAVQTTAAVVEQSGQKMSSAEMFAAVQAQATAFSGTIDSLSADMQKYAQQAQKAMLSGDTEAFDKATAALTNTSAAYAEAKAKAEEYEDALSAIKQSMGMLDDTEAPMMLFDSAEARAQFDALQAKIVQTKQALAESLSAQADTSALQSQLTELQGRFDETEGKISQTKQAIAEAMASGTDTSALQGQLTTLQGQFDEVQAKIEQTKQSLAEAMASGTDTSALQSQLSSLQGQFSSMQSAAVEAATSLGADLGGRASQAQQTLVELQAAITAQTQKISHLQQACAEAAAELQSLKDSESATQSEISIATVKLEGYTQSLQSAQNEMANLKANQIDAQTQWASVSKEVEAHNSVLVKMLGGQEQYNEVLGAMPAPLRSVVSGINGMTGAAKAFIATPLGAVIAAITIAVQALVTWFNSSVEGQMKFAEISGYVSGVLGQLKEIVISVGKAIYEAFTNPKKAASEFLDYLKSQVTNRIKAIGELFGSLGGVISNVFKGDFDAASESLAKMRDSFVDFTTGIEGTTDKVGKWASSVKEAAEATAQISRGEKELSMEASAWQIKKAKLENEMAETKRAMYDTSLTKAKHKEYAEHYKQLIQQVGEGETALAKKELEFQEKRMSLTTNSIEDENRRNELEANVVHAEGYVAQQMRMLQRMENRINGTSRTSAPTSKADTEAKAKEQEAEALAKQAKDSERAVKDLQFAVEQARINAMEEGEKKLMAQMQLNHQRELEEFERQKADYLQTKVTDAKAVFSAKPENKDKKFDESSVKLTAEETGLFDKMRADILKKQQLDQKQQADIQKAAMDEYLLQWGDFTQKRQAIIDIANAKMAAATTEGEKKSIAAQMTKDLSGLDIEANKTTSAISKLFGDMSKKSVKELRAIAAEGARALDLLTSDTYDKDLGLQLGISEETWQTLKKSPSELDKIRKGIQQITDSADSIETPLNKIKKGLDDIFSSGDDTEKLKKALEELKSGLGEVFSAVSVLSSAFSSLGDAFGSDLMRGIADGLNGAMDAVNSAMQGAQTGWAIGGAWGAAAGAAIGLIGSLGSSLAKLHDAKHEKKIQQLQQQAEALQESYDKLGDEIEKAYSKDASKMIEQQNKLLEQQKAILQQQINEEKAKKKTDNDRIKEWQDQIDQINETIADNKEKAIDAIFGADLKSAIEDFASAYADAWAQGENRTKSAKEAVRSMMRQMVTESIKAAIESSGAMERIRQKLQEFYADNVLSGWEQDYILDMAQQLQQQLDQQFAWADSLLTDSDFQQSGSSGGFQSMSEDTASELNGRFAALQISSEKTLSEMILIRENSEIVSACATSVKDGLSELQNIGLLQLTQLEIISKNTKELYDISDKLGKIERVTQNL